MVTCLWYCAVLNSFTSFFFICFLCQCRCPGLSFTLGLGFVCVLIVVVLRLLSFACSSLWVVGWLLLFFCNLSRYCVRSFILHIDSSFLLYLSVVIGVILSVGVVVISIFYFVTIVVIFLSLSVYSWGCCFFVVVADYLSCYIFPTPSFPSARVPVWYVIGTPSPGAGTLFRP